MAQVSRGVSLNFQGIDMVLGNKLFKMSQEHGMTPERLVILALYVGLQVVDDQLIGIRFDMDAAGYSLTGLGRMEGYLCDPVGLPVEELKQEGG